MKVIVNDVFFNIETQKEADIFIQKVVKEHLSQPYFYLLDKIHGANRKCLNAYENDRYASGDRYATIERKLREKRNEYLNANSCCDPKPLKIEIIHE